MNFFINIKPIMYIWIIFEKTDTCSSQARMTKHWEKDCYNDVCVNANLIKQLKNDKSDF